MQLAELREYAGRRGWEVVEEFTDQGVSGCKESRPALNRLMSDAGRDTARHILGLGQAANTQKNSQRVLSGYYFNKWLGLSPAGSPGLGRRRKRPRVRAQSATVAVISCRTQLAPLLGQLQLPQSARMFPLAKISVWIHAEC